MSSNLRTITFILFLIIGNVSMAAPFSFAEIQKVPSFPLRNPSYIKASDGCQLAYYAFVPNNPQTIVIFYTGAGFYGNKIHQWIAKELQEKYIVGAYVVDIRGHGNSGGVRGDAPTIQMVWNDISVVIDYVRGHYPNALIYLAGHSSGAGLLLNYAARYDYRSVDGLILLAPYLGPQSGTLKEHKNPELQFAKKIRSWVYIMAGMSNGRLAAHIPAVYFNYPQSVLSDEKILSYYTYTMSQATTPYQTMTIFRSIEIPTAMFIAAEDEQFIAEATAQYADYIPSSVYRHAEIIKNSKHLTLLLQAPKLITQAIEHFMMHTDE